MSGALWVVIPLRDSRDARDEDDVVDAELVRIFETEFEAGVYASEVGCAEDVVAVEIVKSRVGK